MDSLTPQRRRQNMEDIRLNDTKPEIIVRKGLWRRQTHRGSPSAT